MKEILPPSTCLSGLAFISTTAQAKAYLRGSEYLPFPSASAASENFLIRPPRTRAPPGSEAAANEATIPPHVYGALGMLIRRIRGVSRGDFTARPASKHEQTGSGCGFGRAADETHSSPLLLLLRTQEPER